MLRITRTVCQVRSLFFLLLEPWLRLPPTHGRWAKRTPRNQARRRVRARASASRSIQGPDVSEHQGGRADLHRPAAPVAHHQGCGGTAVYADSTGKGFSKGDVLFTTRASDEGCDGFLQLKSTALGVTSHRRDACAECCLLRLTFLRSGMLPCLARPPMGRMRCAVRLPKSWTESWPGAQIILKKLKESAQSGLHPMVALRLP